MEDSKESMSRTDHGKGQNQTKRGSRGGTQKGSKMGQFQPIRISERGEIKVPLFQTRGTKTGVQNRVPGEVSEHHPRSMCAQVPDIP